MSLFLQQVVGGLTIGAVYAFLALALVFCFRSTGVVNFAQGEMAMFSTYLAWQMHAWGVPFFLAIAGSLGLSLAIGAAVYWATIRPLANASHLAVVGVTVGLFFCFNSLAQLVWGGLGKDFPQILPGPSWRLGPVVIGRDTASIFLLLGVTLVALYVFFEHTRLGLGSRAAAAAPMQSRQVGLPVQRLFLLGWGVAALIGALAGVTVAPELGLSPDMMLLTVIYAFAAATLGGFNSLVGAVVGGLVVGVGENLAGTYIPAIGGDLKVSVALFVILLVLLVRPSGLFGRPEAVRL